MFNKKAKGKKASANKVFNICNLIILVKAVVLVLVACFVYKAFIKIPADRIDNEYYINIPTQGENGEQIIQKVKISEARSLCHFDSLRQAQEAAQSEDLPENFNVNALYENQFVLCLRGIGL